jgi:uncharacterized protein YdeI (YjbR/CyaY-like superfamily)
MDKLIVMKLGKTLYVINRKQWRSWLAKNHKNEKEIWLIYYKKSSGKPRIPYNDAVEEALCYGWIDSIVKRVDEHSCAQRFTPRRPGSILSQTNRERLRKMVSEGRMTSHGLNAVSHAFDHKKEDKLKIPKEILEEIKANPTVWKHFNAFSDSYKRIRIEYIKDQKKYVGEAAYKKSLSNFIKKTEKNIKFGQFID